jgi:riboflavin synthase
MFTGIIEEVGQIISISDNKLTVAASKIVRNMGMGDSVAVNGVCLTVIKFDNKSFSVDIMQETINRTNLRTFTPGDKVNLENALTLNKSLGGHLVQGHIDATGIVQSVNKNDTVNLIQIQAPPQVMRYIVEKSFISMDGISLTVTNRNDHGFGVSIVNYTLANTRLVDLKMGDEVNLEVDIIAKYVEQFMNHKDETISMEFLKEHGFFSV